MAEDDRTIAEGSASRSLQGGMGLHLRGSCLQSGSHAESSDSSVVGQDRSVFVCTRKSIRAPPADAAKDSSLSHRIETQRESESRRMFFRSLLNAGKPAPGRRQSKRNYHYRLLCVGTCPLPTESVR